MTHYSPRLQIHPHSLYALISVTLLLCFATPARADTTADSVLARIYSPELRAKIWAITSLSAEGEITLAGMTGKLAIRAKSPDKLENVAYLGPLTIRQIVNGDRGWVVDQNGSASALGGEELRLQKTGLYMQSAGFLRTDNTPRVYIGVETYQSRGCHKFRFGPVLDTPSGSIVGPSIEALIDSVTGDILLTRMRTGDITIESRHSDFREVAGVRMSFAQDEVASLPQLSAKLRITRLDANVAIPDSAFLPPVEMKSDTRWTHGADSVIVPLVFLHGHAHIDAIINGNRKVRLLLDTGAGTNLISDALVDSLGLAQVGNMAALGMAGVGNVSFVTIDEIAIGDFHLDSQVVGAIDLNAALPGGALDGLDGILGYDFFSRVVAKFRFADSVMILYPPTRGGKLEGKEIPFVYEMKIPAIEARIADTVGLFIVDLGNNADIIIGNAFAHASGLDTLADPVSSARLGGVGGSVVMKQVQLPIMEIGKLTFSDIPALISPKASGLSARDDLAGNIGMKFLRQYDITFDYPRARLFINRRSN